MAFGGGGDAAGEPEEVVAHRLQLHCGVVGDTQVFGGVFEEAAFYVSIFYALYLDAAVDAFELVGGVVIGEVGDLGLDGDELGFVVVTAIEPGFQGLAGAVLQAGYQQAVAEPVEQQESQQQYGRNLLQLG